MQVVHLITSRSLSPSSWGILLLITGADWATIGELVCSLVIRGLGVFATFIVWLCLSNLFGLMAGSGGTEMPKHLVTASNGGALGATETEAWGQSFRLGRDFSTILVCKKAISLFAFLIFFAGLLFPDILLFSSLAGTSKL